MPKNLKRYEGKGDLHFVTFSCYGRRPLLSTDAARTLFVITLEEIRKRHQFLVVGYVVMPEHVHLMISEPPNLSYSEALKALKQRVSRDLRASTRTFAEPPKNSQVALDRFWQFRFHDFNVHSSRKRREKLNYMHANPVNRGLVTSQADWPWSSHLYYQTGIQGPVTITPVP